MENVKIELNSEPVDKPLIKIDRLDVKIAIAVCLCLLTAKFIPAIQYMSSCFAAILCMQETVKMSWKIGVTRLIITVIGGTAGMLVVLLDETIQNEWIFLLITMAGILVTIWGCKLAKVPYISAKIGCVTFILVIMVMNGTDRLMYAGFRVLGTFYGVVVSSTVAIVFNFLLSKKIIFTSKYKAAKESGTKKG